MSDGLKSINILGLGKMGEQISALLFLLGYDIFVCTSKNQENAKNNIEKNIKLLRRSGINSESSSASINILDNIHECKPNLTIECLPEDLEIKKTVINDLLHKSKGFTLVTNTSSIPPGEIHEDLIGLHFFNPIAKLRFFEFYSPHNTLSNQICQLLTDLASAGFTQINVQANGGYIANFFIFREISSLFEIYENYSYNIEDINLVLSCLNKNISFENCIQLLDLIGIDVANQIFNNFSRIYKMYHPRILIEAEEKGILGKKNKTSIRALLLK